ncbi:MAG TPA: phospholipid carrier-dependent glycosyltransferase [Alphaproteobacteria bacterium]|nr:phospholipid carrier-dependent glycosyltransferase [Alphaproteobacteria bacterium]
MQSSLSAERRSIAADLLLLALVIGGIYLVLLGQRPLSVPSEARYAEIPREMLASGDWLTPRLNGVKYFEKPPLFYWLQAADEAMFGRSEFAVRVLTAAFGVGGCLVVYVAGRASWSRRAGLLAAGTMATSVLYFELSRQVLLDMPVAFFLTATFTAFLLGIRAPPASPARSRAMYLMYAMAAGATLTKGLIGIALPGLVVLTWLILTGRWSELRHVRLPTGTLLFLVLTVPWHVAVALRNPEFAWFYFVHEHVLRFLTPEAGRSEPVWFFIPILIIGWLPWVVYLPSAIWESVGTWWADRRERSAELLVLLWFLLPFLFFSASRSKLIPYALPFFPPLSLLLGAWLDRALERERRLMRGALLLLSVLLIGLALLTDRVHDDPQLFIPQRYLAAAAPALGHLMPLTYGLALAAIALGWMARRDALGAAIAVTLAGSAAFGLAVDAIVGAAQPGSTKPLAMMLDPRLRPGDEVASLFSYPQDLPFYLNRRITVAATGGDELDFGRSVEDTRAWMVGEDEFWRRWSEPGHTMYAVIPLARYAELSAGRKTSMVELGRTASDVLVSNIK